MLRPKRFVPGFFQRSVIDIQEEIADQEEYVKYWEKRTQDANERLREIVEDEAGDEPEVAAQLAKIEDATNVVKESRDELNELRRLRQTIKTEPDLDRFPFMVSMVNTNFSETYADYMCMSSYPDIVFDIEFPHGAPPESIEHTYNPEYEVGGPFLCAKRSKPIFLKIEEPGHMLCALIFVEEGLCEIWNTAAVSKSIRRFFVALLPHYYTVMCINAQLQVKWCAEGKSQNVYVIKQKGAKAMLNIYCQTWPYFFAYMRCVKRFSALDVLKFLSCLTDLQKTTLIDEFNTSLANRGEDIQYIQEINDPRMFKKYVKSCNPLLNMQKSIKFVGAKDIKDYRELAKQISNEDFVVHLRSFIGKF